MIMEKEKQIKEFTDDLIKYTFERLEEKLKDFKIEFRQELEKQLKRQKEEILIGYSRIADRINPQ